jgi:endonuclease/exonuclease/phosphatase family metal-dependent hydrolase
MIGVHIKSKAPHGARTEAEILRLSIANRRKQLAQCVWLRRRVEAVLAAGDSLIVLGDFNDGPGLDEYEKIFGRSGVEIVMGDSDKPLYDPHARMALHRRTGAAPVSARFFIAPENRWLSALLDFVMVSADLRALHPRWRIWHPFDDPVCYRDIELRRALMHASDHFPVSVDIDL